MKKKKKLAWLFLVLCLMAIGWTAWSAGAKAFGIDSGLSTSQAPSENNEFKHGSVPRDADAWWTTVITHDSWKSSPTEAQLVQWFSADPGLVRIRETSHYRHYTTRTPEYVDTYKQFFPHLPAVVLQDASGRVRYCSFGASGVDAVPTSAVSLRNDMDYVIKDAWQEQASVRNGKLFPRRHPRDEPCGPGGPDQPGRAT